MCRGPSFWDQGHSCGSFGGPAGAQGHEAVGARKSKPPPGLEPAWPSSLPSDSASRPGCRALDVKELKVFCHNSVLFMVSIDVYIYIYIYGCTT